MYTEFEQDLILACKSWYGEKGIEKVIADYIGYTIGSVGIDSIYHFILGLYLKLCKNKHLDYSCLLERFSPRHIYDYRNGNVFNNAKYSLYDFPRIVCDYMIAEICGLEIQKGDKVLIELHEANEKFLEKDIAKV